jgi:hypothetical protein
VSLCFLRITVIEPFMLTLAMFVKRIPSLSRYCLAVAVLLLTGCTRAPSFNIVGSFFPAWLVCLMVAVLLTVLSGWLLLRLDVPLPVPALTYPSLTALLTFGLWLVFFGW